MGTGARKLIVSCLFLILILIFTLGIFFAVKTGRKHAGVLGTVFSAGHYDGKPYYWEDEHPFELSDKPGRALGITVSGGSVYISGHIKNGPRDEACYWVDGEFKSLELGENYRNSYANAITVHNGVVYAAGFFNDGVVDIACYWKNGKTKTKAELPFLPGETNFHANGIGIRRGKPQLSGYYTSGGKSIAFRWNEGDKAKSSLPGLPYGDLWSAAYTLKSQDDSVYIAGCYNDGNRELACFWENGVKNNLPPAPGETRSYAYDITVKDRVVYVTGDFYTDAGPGAAFFWKTGDTQKTVVSVPGGRGVGIAVLRDYVYVCGYEDDGAGKFPPCYWQIQENKETANIAKTRLTDSDIPAAVLAIGAAGN